MKAIPWVGAIALAISASGCILPVSTGAPLPATTVGAGKVGFALSGEFPTLNLISNNTSSNQNSDLTYDRGEAPAIAATATLSYGLGEDTDAELAIEGALYYGILPLPTGISAGLRQHLGGGDTFDIALAGRVGGLTTGTTKTDGSDTSTDDSASAEYAAVQGVVQLRNGVIRPMLAVNVMGFKITRAPENEPVERFKGIAESVTLGFSFVSRHAQITPYVCVTTFESEQFRSSFFASGGIALAFRRDRNRKEDIPPPSPYSYPAPGQPSPPPPAQQQPLPPPPPGPPLPMAPPPS